MVESVTRTRYFAGISRNTVLLAFASLFADISSAPHRFSLFVPVHWGCLPEASQAQGHRCWLESRHAFIGQARVPSPAPFGPFHRLRGAGTHETSGKRRRPTCRDWMSPFAIVSPEWRPRRNMNPNPQIRSLMLYPIELQGKSRSPKPSLLPFFARPTVSSSSSRCVSGLRGSSCADQPYSMPQGRRSPVQFVPFRPASLLSVLSYSSFVSFLTLRNKIHCRQHGN